MPTARAAGLRMDRLLEGGPLCFPTPGLWRREVLCGGGTTGSAVWYVPQADGAGRRRIPSGALTSGFAGIGPESQKTPPRALATPAAPAYGCH